MPMTLQELRVAASFLRQAKALADGVRDFFRGHDTDAAARLNDISQRLDDEHDYVGRLIAAAPGGEDHS